MFLLLYFAARQFLSHLVTHPCGEVSHGTNMTNSWKIEKAANIAAKIVENIEYTHGNFAVQDTQSHNGYLLVKNINRH